jgi:hypothetical protein
VPDWSTLLSNVADTVGVISINHPVRPSGEQCMGCGWTPRLLNRGYELTALGGSDNHDALLRNSGAIGTPTTLIFADELSQAGIVAAIRRGRVVIDVAGTRDRSVDLTATVGKQVAPVAHRLQWSLSAVERL